MALRDLQCLLTRQSWRGALLVHDEALETIHSALHAHLHNYNILCGHSSIYSLFKPEPETHITCKVYRYPYSRFPIPLLSRGTTPLLNNIRFAVLRAAPRSKDPIS